MRIRPITCVLVFILACSAPAMSAVPTTARAAISDAEAQYNKDINKRGDDTIAALKLNDTAKAERVKQLVMNQYRSLRALHDARDAKLKDIGKDDKAAIDKTKADTEAAIKPLHEEFVAKLNAELTPEQVEIVKDKMTMGRRQHDWGGFTDMLPDLTDAQKQYISAQLKEAREIAIDKGSAKEKHVVFDKYRGRINNYLSKQGYDLKQASKDWAERRKARESQAKQAAATQPAN
jgi:uncharacterized protein YpuA (DUF1002 family)